MSSKRFQKLADRKVSSAEPLSSEARKESGDKIKLLSHKNAKILAEIGKTILSIAPFRSLDVAGPAEILRAAGKDAKEIGELLVEYNIESVSYKPVRLALGLVSDYTQTGKFNIGKASKISILAVASSLKIAPLAMKIKSASENAHLPPVLAANASASQMLDDMINLEMRGALAHPDARNLISFSINQVMPKRTVPADKANLN